MYKKFRDYLLNINRYEAREFVLKNKDKMNVIEHIIIPALTDIGTGWQNGEYSLSQVYMSSVICEDISEELFTLQENELHQKLSLAIVTFDDYHTFGKKLVTLSMRSSGYHIEDFGMIFNEEELLKLVQKHKVDVLMMSVLMLPPALKIKQLRPKLLEINPNIKIIVGGAPFRFDKELYKEVGADYTGANPHEALELVKELEAKL